MRDELAVHDGHRRMCNREFYRCRGNRLTMCEFHKSICNGFGDIWWTDNPIYFSSIDYCCHPYCPILSAGSLLKLFEHVGLPCDILLSNKMSYSSSFLTI